MKTGVSVLKEKFRDKKLQYASIKLNEDEIYGMWVENKNIVQAERFISKFC